MVATDHIDSPKNPRVRSWVALRNRKEREATRTFLVEGERETTRMAESCDLVTHIVRDDRPSPPVGEVVTVSPRVFDVISTRENPDGVAAVFHTPDLDTDRLAGVDLVLVGDGVEKPGNIGAMLRTADAFGAGFLGSSLGTDLVNHNVIRAAQGSLFASPQASVSREQAVAWTSGGTRIVVATPDADAVLWDVDFTVPTSIVIGAEAEGVDDAWLAIGERVRIPTKGRADSLNASVSAAVMLSEAVRQRSG